MTRVFFYYSSDEGSSLSLLAQSACVCKRMAGLRVVESRVAVAHGSRLYLPTELTAAAAFPDDSDILCSALLGPKRAGTHESAMRSGRAGDLNEKVLDRVCRSVETLVAYFFELADVNV